MVWILFHSKFKNYSEIWLRMIDLHMSTYLWFIFFGLFLKLLSVYNCCTVSKCTPTTFKIKSNLEKNIWLICYVTNSNVRDFRICMCCIHIHIRIRHYRLHVKLIFKQFVRGRCSCLMLCRQIKDIFRFTKKWETNFK